MWLLHHTNCEVAILKTALSFHIEGSKFFSFLKMDRILRLGSGGIPGVGQVCLFIDTYAL